MNKCSYFILTWANSISSTFLCQHWTHVAESSVTILHGLTAPFPWLLYGFRVHSEPNVASTETERIKEDRDQYTPLPQARKKINIKRECTQELKCIHQRWPNNSCPMGWLDSLFFRIVSLQTMPPCHFFCYYSLLTFYVSVNSFYYNLLHWKPLFLVISIFGKG